MILVYNLDCPTRKQQIDYFYGRTTECPLMEIPKILRDGLRRKPRYELTNTVYNFCDNTTTRTYTLV